MPDVGISGVVKRFGAITAVDGIDLNVQDGEMVTLLGPSGCGKTTTLRMIAGLEEPDAGAIRIGGMPVYDAARRIDVPSERRHLGMVFQSYAIWPHMTCTRTSPIPCGCGAWAARSPNAAWTRCCSRWTSTGSAISPRRT